MIDNNLRLITDDEKKSLLVEIMKKLDVVFKENDITYYLAYGTLLGAVRHQGFIPWDDDVDLLVPREGFIRLIRLLEEKREEFKSMNLEILEYGRNKKDYFKRYKIADTRTVMEEYGEERSAVFVDIFPLDCFPKAPVEKLKKKCRKVVLIDNLWSLCNAGVAQGSGIKKIIYTMLLLAHKIVGCERMKKYYEKKELAMTKFCKDGVVCYSEGAASHGKFMNVADWLKPTEMCFEGEMFSAPENYDAVLNIWYGDYMTLPPENERHSHEYYTMYWR